MNTESETSRSDEKKTHDLRQEFSDLPFDRKLATLLQLETVTLTEAFDKVANASASLGRKIFDSVLSEEPIKCDQNTAHEKEKPA